LSLFQGPCCSRGRSLHEFSLPMCYGLQDIRLMAAVVAKNAVGSSWRKIIATREWSRVPSTSNPGLEIMQGCRGSCNFPRHLRNVKCPSEYAGFSM
jgi:hypothetical protein